MNVWGAPDRLEVLEEAAGRRGHSGTLVAEIAEALSAAGEYVARVDLQPRQRAVDFSWAAREAGRRLGIRVEVDLQLARPDAQGRVLVRVTPATFRDQL